MSLFTRRGFAPTTYGPDEPLGRPDAHACGIGWSFGCRMRSGGTRTLSTVASHEEERSGSVLTAALSNDVSRRSLCDESRSHGEQ
jgi:hypothetical protein